MLKFVPDPYKTNPQPLTLHPQHPTNPEPHAQVLWFWQIMRSLSQDERSMVLQFVTGNERPPLTGFQALEHPFTVQVSNPKPYTLNPTP